MGRIITLLTDFGTADGYAGAVKGVIKRTAPQAELIDISHDVQPFRPETAAFALLNYYDQFPVGTIHLAVVDPGVGSPRLPLLIITENYFFIGPDNGLFGFVLKREDYRAYEILPGQLPGSAKSSTFHARDIFAPAAALLAKGTDTGNFCRPLDRGAQPCANGLNRRANRLEAAILCIDHFGNVITGLHRDDTIIKKDEKISRIGLKDFECNQICQYYAQKKTGQLLALWNSAGFLEIAAASGRAADLLDVDPQRDKVVLTVESKNK